MITRTRSLLGIIALTGMVAAGCSDSSNPTGIRPTSPNFSGRVGGGVDTSLVSGGGGGGGGAAGGGGGGGGGGGNLSVACGKLSPTTTYQTVLYTTRVGIGFYGTATNCSTGGGGGKVLEVDVVDQAAGTACEVAVPHYLSLKAASAGTSITWAATSTLVYCQGTTHWFTVTLRDASTGTVLDTQVVSAFN